MAQRCARRRANGPPRSGRRCDERARGVSRDGRLCRFRVAGLRLCLGRARRIGAAFLAALPRQRHGARPRRGQRRPGPMTRKQRRLTVLTLGLAALAAATALVLFAFSENLVFFYGPSELAAKPVAPDRRIRIGGLVEAQSLKRNDSGRGVAFRVTDGKSDVVVVYDGILPDLFREEQGVV